MFRPMSRNGVKTLLKTVKRNFNFTASNISPHEPRKYFTPLLFASGWALFLYLNHVNKGGVFIDQDVPGTVMYMWKKGEHKGDVYDGEWRDGKMNGLGKMRYANGDFYQGHFKDGMRHGHGKMKTVSGMMYEGEWQADKVISSFPTDSGRT